MSYSQLILSDMLAETARRNAKNQADYLSNIQIENEIEDKALMRGDLAYALSLRCALEGAVRRLVGKDHPVVPILDDKFLRERIGNAGITTWNATKDWVAVRNAGYTFSVPEEPDLLKNYVSIALYNERTELCNYRTQLWAERGTTITKLEVDARVKDEAIAKLQATVENLRASNEVLRKERAMLNQLAENNQVLESGKDLEIKELVKDCAHHLAQSRAFRRQLTNVDPFNPLVTDSALRQRLSERAYEMLAATDFKDWSVVRKVGDTFISDNDRSSVVETRGG